MAYTPTYTEDDAAPIVIDVGLLFLASIGALAGVLGLIWVVNRIRKGTKNLM